MNENEKDVSTQEEDVVTTKESVAEEERTDENATAEEVAEERENAAAEAAQENAVNVEEKPAESGTSEKEKFTALSKNKTKIADFTALAKVEAKYSVADGLDTIVNTLKSKYRYLSEAFLQLAETKSAFRTTCLYAPVYRMKAQANYYWKKGKGTSAMEHFSQASVTEVASVAPAYLNAADFALQNVESIDQKLEEAQLIANKKVNVKDCVKALKEKAAKAAPDKKADLVLSDESYELVYVPVLKAELTFEDKTYTQWVNLANGNCETEYVVADVAVTAAEKTMAKVAQRKRSIFACVLYTLTFLVLNILHWQLGSTQNPDGTTEGLMLTLILGGVALLCLVVWGACFTYNKQKLIDRAVTKGKLASAKAVAALNLVAFLLAVASVVLFAVFVLI